MRLSGPFRPPSSLRVAPVDAFQHVAELSGGDGHSAVYRRRPDEPAAFQSSGVERHADTVVPENLQKVASAPTEHVKVATMGIAPQRLLYLKRQTIHTTTHVCDARREPHPHTRRWNNHPRSTNITRRSAARFTSLPTRTRLPSGRLISICPSFSGSTGNAGAELTADGAGPLTTCTGRNADTAARVSRPRRA